MWKKICNIFSILCFIISRKVKMQWKQTKKHLCSLWRRCYDWSTCLKLFAKFHAGDFSLDDAPQLCRPVEVDRDQIETLIENNQCSTKWELADTLKISKWIKLLVKMKNVSFILQKKLNRLFGQPNIFNLKDY